VIEIIDDAITALVSIVISLEHHTLFTRNCLDNVLIFSDEKEDYIGDELLHYMTRLILIMLRF